MPTNLRAATGTTGTVIDPATGDGVLNIYTGATAGSQVLAASFAADGTPTFLKARGVAQVQTFQTGAVATGTTVIPYDDTIPQITEGDQYMSLAITPTNASSTLEIDVVCILGSATTSSWLFAALFKDSAANALAAAPTFQAQGTAINTITFKHVIPAGSTASQTFSVRGGSTAGTTTFNGASGARVFGGVMASRITIKEYLP